MDELTRRTKEISQSAASAAVGLQPNALYLVKLRAVSAAPSEHVAKLRLQLGFLGAGETWSQIRAMELALPVVSDEDAAYAQRGRWYEQAIFVRTDAISNALRWAKLSKDDSRLVVSASPVFVDAASAERLRRLLAEQGSKTTRFSGRTYRPFLGVPEALAYIDDWQQQLAQGQLPQLDAMRVPAVPSFPRVGVIGDDLLAGMLETSFNAVKISPATVSLIENAEVDVVVLQQRAAGISPRGSSMTAEEEFVADLGAALVRTEVPVLQLAPFQDAFATLQPLRAATTTAVTGSEFEFASVAPLRQKAWSATTIAMPCASDLYQSPEFQETARRLVESGFRLAISESNFDHVPIRTWERFFRPEVKVYGRLGVREQVELFRSCGFVVLPADSLRPLADIVNLAMLAVMSGALPIVVGRTLPEPLARIVQCVWSYRELHAFLAQNSAMLVRERQWLSRFRLALELRRRSDFCHAVEEAAAGVRLPRNPLAQPSAEMVCVSKRPDKLPQILANFRRQAYDNLGLHLVWNVPADAAQACLDASNAKRLPNMRVTVLDETYNIGSCLNHGIRNSQADYWFKIDDDDYYGRHYIADLVNFYEVTGCDASGKPSGFLFFEHEKELYLRGHAEAQARRPLEKGAYFCGATLSGRRSSQLPLFSTEYRNSCDSRWVESAQAGGHRIELSDIFNFCINRGDLLQHTWQIDKEQIERKSTLVAGAPCREWLNAD
jgi:hypothetical protein